MGSENLSLVPSFGKLRTGSYKKGTPISEKKE
jgi:hypothetical protein